MIENYWPGTERLLVLRREWPIYTPIETIILLINRIPAPKPVTRWQCWMMASHLHIRRPDDWFTHCNDVRKLGSHVSIRYHRRRAQARRTNSNHNLLEATPEKESKLRKVGRKPAVKRAKTRLHSPGLSMGRGSLVRTAAALHKMANDRKAAKRKYYHRNKKKKPQKALTSTIWPRSPMYIPRWFNPEGWTKRGGGKPSRQPRASPFDAIPE